MTVHVEQGEISVVEIRRPDRANAYDDATLAALEDALGEAIHAAGGRAVAPADGSPGRGETVPVRTPAGPWLGTPCPRPN